jgi:hypothetical protein
MLSIVTIGAGDIEDSSINQRSVKKFNGQISD